jgi:hypothetical protein
MHRLTKEELIGTIEREFEEELLEVDRGTVTWNLVD